MSGVNVHSSFYGLNGVPLKFLLNLVEALTPSVTVFGDRASMGVIKVK